MASAAARRGLSVERVTDAATVHETWDELAAASRNIFTTREWVQAWSRHLAPDEAVDVRRVRDPEGDTVAVAALVRSRNRGVRLLRFAGSGPADELGPACAPERRDAVLAALTDALAAEGGWDVMLAEGLQGPVDPAVLGGAVVAEDASPVIDLPPGGWEAFLAARSKNFRGQVRSKERRLLRAHDVSCRRSDDPERLSSDLEVLFALHDRRWGGGADTFTGPRREFHRDFAHRALERGWLRLWLLEVAGTPVAAWYGFRFAGVESFYQSGRDPQWEEWSVGRVLLNHTIRAAADDGVSAYRLLRGAEAYKTHYATSDPGLRTVAVAGSPIGRVAVAAARRSQGIPALRGWLKRLRDTGAPRGPDGG